MIDPAEAVRALCDSASELVFHPLPTDDPTQRRPDIAREQLGWKPGVPLEEGLQPTVAWFRELIEAGWRPGG